MMKIKIFVSVVASAILILGFSLSVFGLMAWNETTGGFLPPNSGSSADSGLDGSRRSHPTLRQYIIEGTGRFLNSRSDFLLFLTKIELSELNGLDCNEAREIMNGTIEKMEGAIGFYFKLKTLAAVTEYNQYVNNQLKTFDYNRFQQEKGLNPTIFQRVEGFLSKGDIRGVYEWAHRETELILLKLKQVKLSVDSNAFPQLTVLWELNQDYFNVLLFGQYVTQVFYNLDV
ncbi:MAG: hypothetical protein GY940_20565 [bacterium]|nr:hypothetical protein [bacterium]